MKRSSSSRLTKLEQRNSTDGTLSHNAKRMLVEILGRFHALWWPWRFQLNSKISFTEIRCRQRECLSGITGIQARGSGREADWKSSHETRIELIASGLVTGIGAAGQISSVLLTRKGEGIAWGLVGSRLADGRQSQIAFLLLEVLTDERQTPIREHELLQCPSFGNPEDWNDKTETMLPLLTCGVVRATSDTTGRILYSFTKGDKPPEPEAVGVEPEDWCDSAYLTAYNAERAFLSSVEPRDPHEVFVPIPRGVCWQKPDEEITREEE